eukprot:CAMPEP_0170589440 /NCGR_PEP_ID=MMETSP0224-20130122/11350_1 /TAXON_ID=285029 /ORGANISM="Togula jolla, Strain CCCM 725" /LENGTH=165 /DNA_ID=CAMNT_0010913195 /DNA_START=55 /DNA_END=549 /DNA_ORIENTATION=-
MGERPASELMAAWCPFTSPDSADRAATCGHDFGDLLALASALDRALIDAARWAVTKRLPTDAHNARMDGARDAVDHLHIELGQHEGGVGARLADISLRRCIHDVPDLEALHGLVLRHAPGAVGAPDDGRVATAMLGASIVTALGGHCAGVLRAGHKCLSQIGLSQ